MKSIVQDSKGRILTIPCLVKMSGDFGQADNKSVGIYTGLENESGLAVVYCCGWKYKIKPDKLEKLEVRVEQ